MANIPDFTSEAYDNPEDFRRELTRVLRDLNADATRTVTPNLGDNTLLQWVDDGSPLPRGYVVANGQNNGSFDASKSKVILIQKVK